MGQVGPLASATHTLYCHASLLRRLLAELGYAIVQKVDLQSCGVSAVELGPMVSLQTVLICV